MKKTILQKHQNEFGKISSHSKPSQLRHPKCLMQSKVFLSYKNRFQSVKLTRSGSFTLSKKKLAKEVHVINMSLSALRCFNSFVNCHLFVYLTRINFLFGTVPEGIKRCGMRI